FCCSFCQVSVLPDKLWYMTRLLKSQYIVEYQHLSIAIRSSTNTDCGDGYLLRDDAGKRCRNALKHQGKNASLSQGFGILDQCTCSFNALALDSIPPHHVDRL